MSVRDWFAAGLQLVTNQLSAMKLDQLKRFRRLLYSWFKFTRTGQVKVSYQATSIQKPVLDCLCPLRDCLLFTKDRLILVSIILAAAKTCGFSAGLVTGRSLVHSGPRQGGWRCFSIQNKGVAICRSYILKQSICFIQCLDSVF